MELTIIQIQQIETYIINKGIDYIDLKVEILDHMVADVEDRMKENGSFETAFYQTKYKWNKHFRSSSSIYFGFHYSQPKIILKKAINEFRPFYFLYLLAYFIPLIIATQFEFTATKTVQFFFNTFYKVLSFASLIYMIFLFLDTV